MARDVGRPASNFPCPPGAVGKTVLEIRQCHNRRIGARRCLRAKCGRQDMAANFEITGLDVTAIQMKHELFGNRNIDADTA